MKKILYTLFIGLLTLTSCTDFLEENAYGKQSSENFFSQKEDLAASLNALYSVVATSQQENDFVGTNFLAGDDITTHPASNKQPLREHDQYCVTDNNSWMVNLWEQRFKVIKAANFIINNAYRTPDVSKEAIVEAVAQAHFWRAYSLFYLVTTWGEVPVMLKEEINYNAKVWSVEEIYTQIVADLKIAEDGCPITYNSAPYHNGSVNVAVSKPAVKAAMAYVYMCMAGWPLNKGVEYYALAASKAKEVIDNVDLKTYDYRLLDDYADVYSVEYTQKNPELLLGIYYHRDRAPQMTPLTDLLLDMKIGGWGDTHGEIKFWKEFPEGPRKEATYLPKILLADDVLHDWWYDNGGTREVVAPVFNKSSESANRGEEFDYTSALAPPQFGQKTIQVIRLSEVYCWYAEASARAGEVTSMAVDVLNRVRNRADGATTNLYSMAMSAEEIAEAAYNEHGWEMAGYYWCGFAPRARDMFRMNRVKNHFEYRKSNPMIEVAPGVLRNETLSVTGEWDDSKMYCPYPYTDTTYNPGLVK
ncbi:MAG: RagB/SusD family nutrient uptake outer membrane protein [Alistipes sp.]|nr:RagB/SusD family nutrient uptake outer membrane protein [Alistipes sp.]